MLLRLMPEFKSQELHSGRRELIPASCPLTAICTLWHATHATDILNNRVDKCKNEFYIVDKEWSSWVIAVQGMSLYIVGSQ